MAQANQIQRGVAHLGAGEQEVLVTVNTVDPTKSILFATCTTTGTGNRGQTLVAYEVVSATQIRFFRGSTSGPAFVINWQLVEFISGVSVQHTKVSMTSSDTHTTTISTVDLGTTFCLVNGAVATSDYTDPVNGSADYDTVSLPNTTTLQAQRLASTTISHDVYVQVIDYDDCSVNFDTATLTGSSESISIPASTKMILSYTTRLGTIGSTPPPLGNDDLAVEGYIASSMANFERIGSSGSYPVEISFFSVQFSDNTVTRPLRIDFDVNERIGFHPNLATSYETVSSAIIAGRSQRDGKDGTPSDLAENAKSFLVELSSGKRVTATRGSDDYPGGVSATVVQFETNSDPEVFFGGTYAQSSVSGTLLRRIPDEEVKVRRVQRGIVALAAEQSVIDVPISIQDITKTLLFFGEACNDDDPKKTAVCGEFLDSQTLRFQRADGTGAAVVMIVWHVVEFTEGVTVQRGAVDWTVDDGDAVSIALDPIDLDQAMPFVNFMSPQDDFGAADFVRARITSGTELELTLGANNPGARVAWQVATFSSAYVQRIDATIPDGQTQVLVDIPSPLPYRTGTPTYLPPLMTSVSYRLLDDGTNMGQRLARAAVTGFTDPGFLNTVAAQRGVAGPELELTLYLAWFFDETKSVPPVQIDFSGSDTFVDTDISALGFELTSVDSERSIVYGMPYGRGGGTTGTPTDNPGYGWGWPVLTSDTVFRVTRGATDSNSAIFFAGVIQFSGVGAPLPAVRLRSLQSGELELGGSNQGISDTIEGIDLSKSLLLFSQTSSISNPSRTQVIGELIDSTTVRFLRDDNGGSSSANTIVYQVAEFLTGVENVQRGVATFGSGATELDVPISLVRTDRSAPVISVLSPSGTFDAGDWVRAQITSGTNLRLTIGAANDGLTVAWQVITFDQGIILHSGEMTLPADQSSAAGVGPTLASQGALLFYTYNLESFPSGVNEAHVAFLVDAMGGAFALRGASTGAPAATIQWYVIELFNGPISGGVQLNFPASTDEVTVSWNVSPLDPAATLLNGPYLGKGGLDTASGDAPGGGWFVFDMPDDTHVRGRRGIDTGTGSALILGTQFQLASALEGETGASSDVSGAMKVMPAGRVALIRAVQRGTATIPQDQAFVEVTINEVNLGSSLLQFSYTVDQDGPDNTQVLGTLSDGDPGESVLRFERSGSTGGNAIEIRYEVFKFRSGKVIVQRGVEEFSSGLTQIDVMLSATVVVDRSVPIISVLSPNANFERGDFVKAEITDTDELQLAIGAANDGLKVAWQVVYFTEGAIVESGSFALPTEEDAATEQDAGTTLLGGGMLLYSYVLGDDPTSVNEALIRLEIENLGVLNQQPPGVFDLIATREAGGSGPSATIQWYFVEFSRATRAAVATVEFDDAVADKSGNWVDPVSVNLTTVDRTRVLFTGPYFHRGGSAESGAQNPGAGWFEFDEPGASKIDASRDVSSGHAQTVVLGVELEFDVVLIGRIDARSNLTANLQTAYDIARSATERVKAEFLEIDLDACANRYGVPPCEAGRVTTGNVVEGSNAITFRNKSEFSITIPGGTVFPVDVEFDHEVLSGTNRAIVLVSAEHDSSSAQKISGATYRPETYPVDPDEPFTKLVDIHKSGDYARFEVLVLLGPSVGAGKIIVTLERPGGYVFTALSYDGIDQNELLVSSAEATGDGTTVFLVVATQQDSSIIVGGIEFDFYTHPGGQIVTGPNQVQRWINGAVAIFSSGGDRFVENTETVTLQWDLINQKYYNNAWAAGAAILPAAVPGGSYITLEESASSTDDAYKGMTVAVQKTDSGTISDIQERKITSYVGSTHRAFVDRPWDVVPEAPQGNTSWQYFVIDRTNACYNTFATCQDRPNYKLGQRTLRFSREGTAIQPGPAPEIRQPEPGVIELGQPDTSRSAGIFGSALEWEHTVLGEDRILLVGITVRVPGLDNEPQPIVVNTVTFRGIPLTRVRSESVTVAADGTTLINELWYLVAPRTGTHTVRVSLKWTTGEQTIPLAYIVGGSLLLSGVDQTDPIVQDFGAQAETGDPDSGDVTALESGGWVVGTTAALTDNKGTLPMESPLAVQWNLAQPDQGTIKVTGSGSTQGPYAKGITTQVAWEFDPDPAAWAIVGVELRVAEVIPAPALNIESRPYVAELSTIPTEINVEKGLAERGVVNITLRDEPVSDAGMDLYAEDRPKPAEGTYWRRLLARNPNYAGRSGRVRRGYVVKPWNWATFRSEHFIIENISGPDRQGRVRLTLKDIFKIADRNKVPTATDGKLLRDFPYVAYEGTVQNATNDPPPRITLDSNAPLTPMNIYQGLTIEVTGSSGIVQTRYILSYGVKGSRVAEVDAPWDPIPQSGDACRVLDLDLWVPQGKGAQYLLYGEPGYARMGEEILKFESVILDQEVAQQEGGEEEFVDILRIGRWSNRAQFDTESKDHRKDAAVQLARFYDNLNFDELIQTLLNDAEISDEQIDVIQLQEQVADFLSDDLNIQALLSKPEKPTALLAELTSQAGAVLWWDPLAARIRFKVITPVPPTAVNVLLTDEASFVEGSIEVRARDEGRLSRAAIYYDLVNPTANLSEAKNYNRAVLHIDADAESEVSFGDIREDVVFSRWFKQQNDAAVQALAARKVAYFSDIPRRIRFQIDPKDLGFKPGDLIDIETDTIVDASGAPERIRVLVVKIEEEGDRIRVEAETTNFLRRYGFIAPDNTPDYPQDKAYAHIAEDDGTMSDGSDPYRIL